MLIYIRGDLLGKDNMGCLQRLMKYPPVEDVKVFVKSALDMRDNTNPPSASEARLQQPPRPTAPTPQHPPRPAAPPPSSAPAPPSHPPPPAMQRSDDSGPNGWLLSGSSSSSSSLPPAPSGGTGAVGSGVFPKGTGGGGQVAFVNGQIVHVGAAGATVPGAAQHAQRARPAQPAPAACAGLGAHKFSKGSSIVQLITKYTSALTFQNFWQRGWVRGWGVVAAEEKAVVGGVQRRGR
jgi:hypothetical protein